MTDAAIAQESLPPVQYLIMETLAARYRLGEPYWTFPLRLRAALDALRDKGLIWTRSAPTPDLQAYLTDAGRACCLSDAYMTPDTRERRDYDDLLGSVWLYIPWKFATLHLTTKQKELFANAVDASNARANADDPDLGMSPVERWWRDGA